MSPDNIHGDWLLVASSSVNAEVEFIDDEPDPDGVSNWLNGVDDELAREAPATSGLTLSIAPDGSFQEQVTGKPTVYWFDAEGVLQAEVTPFAGVIVHNDQVSYLRPNDIAAWAMPIDGQYGKAVLRYDDGDTKIADSVRILGDALVRTVNVVTDELYLDRIVMVYKRAG